MSLFYFLFLFLHILELISIEVKRYVRTLHTENIFFINVCSKNTHKVYQISFSFICPLEASDGFTYTPSLRALKYSPCEVFVRRAILKMKSYRPKQR